MSWRAFVTTLFLALIAGCGGDGDAENGSGLKYTVTAAAEEGGSVTPASAEVSAGQNRAFSIDIEDGYSVDAVTGCEGKLQGSQFVVENVQEDCDLVVRFRFCEDCVTSDKLGKPVYAVHAPLMERICKRGPLYVTGSENVRWDALCAAGDMLAAMLAQRPDVITELRAAGAITAVFAANENVCDLDYFAYLEGQPVCAEAVGGLGGVIGNPTTACSERNLLSLSSDPYRRGTAAGENVCVHELAHTIMNVGLSQALRDEILNRYNNVVTHTHLWKRADGTATFARENDHEFWAEITQSYFSANPEIDSFLHNGVNGPDELEAYDYISFELVDRVFVEPADLR